MAGASPRSAVAGCGKSRPRRGVLSTPAATGSPGSCSEAGGPERPADARGTALAACSAPRYAAVVKIRHKGLRALHERYDHARLAAGQVSRLRRIVPAPRNKAAG